MSVLSALVDDARERYLKSNKPHVIVFSADQVGRRIRLDGRGELSLFLVLKWFFSAQLWARFNLEHC